MIIKKSGEENPCQIFCRPAYSIWHQTADSFFSCNFAGIKRRFT